MSDIVKQSRCGDCAFSPGTKANGTFLQASKASICALVGEPFWCHVGKKETLCAGWTEAVATSEVAPKDQPEWKVKFFRGILDWIASVEARDPHLPNEVELEREYHEMLARLMEKP